MVDPPRDSGVGLCARSSRSSRNALLVAALLFGVMLAHVWVISAGRMALWPQYGSYYDKLVAGFLDGHLYLTDRPPKELLALADPYDPAANEPYKLGDALLYQGRYYLYWGPVPALILAPFKFIAGNVELGDENLVFVFTIGTVGAGALLGLQVRRRFFPEQPWWTVAFPTLAAGFVTPMTFNLARASVYEAAIMGGQFFLMAGILIAFSIVRGGADARRTGWARLALVGACWAAAVGCRASLAPAVTCVAALLLWRLWAWRPDRRVGIALALGLPLAAGAMALAGYNWARFGSMTEFGVRYQLAGINVHAVFDTRLTSSHYVLPNLWRYLFEWPWVRREFPFLIARDKLDWPVTRFALPPEYTVEQVAGVAWSSPYLLLAVAPVLSLFKRRPRVASARSAGAGSAGLAFSSGSAQSWLVLTLSLAAILAFAPPLFQVGSTMRYFADASPAMAALASIGAWRLLRWAGASNGKWWAAAAVTSTLLGITMVIGMLLAITGYYGHFAWHNKPLYRQMKSIRI